MPVTKMDPGLAFGFYCKTLTELENLLNELESFRSTIETPTFYIEDTLPTSKHTNDSIDLQSMNESWGSEDLQSVLNDGDGNGNGGGYSDNGDGGDGGLKLDRNKPKSSGGSSPTRSSGGNEDEWTFL